MRINTIQNCQMTGNFGSNKKIKKDNNITFSKKIAVAESLSTAGAWFGFGVVLDMVSRNIKFSKSPIKNSLAVNGLIAASAGIVTGISMLICKKKIEI